jgi:molybdate transport system ATP-binding protein
MPFAIPSNSGPFLSVQDASFRLGDRFVFENLSWDFRRNQQWALIGPNGSGKSVLADALRGRLPLVRGELHYHFRPPKGLSPEEAIGHVAFEDRKSEVHGTVVQSRWISFEEESSLLVRDFLSYDRVMEINPFEVIPNGTSDRALFERRMRRATGLLRIEKFLQRRLLSLSNGERQRVQLARALAQPLRLLILDEPYVGLDKSMREHFHHALEKLLQSQLRVLLITTRVEDLPHQITHLMRVEDCRMVAAGPCSTVLKRASAPAIVRRELNNRRWNSGRRSLLRDSSQGALISLRNVTVKYGLNVILHNISWDVREGESWALLGPNGSGKTTLLSLLLGDHPQAYVNEVIIFGRRRGKGESIWQLKLRIGWVSPELQLHFDDTVSVIDVVLSGFSETIGLFDTPTKHQVAAAQRWLREFSLYEFADQPLFSLSAGLQRMTLLARALVKSPRLLILDEPCQGLDSIHRDYFIKKVDALIRTGSVTAIFVTHRPDEIPASITRTLRLSRRGVASCQFT